MPGRTIAIGDIHGYSAALASLLEAIAPQPDDILIPLGDYCDRGPDTRGVIDRLIALSTECQLAPILGNHDEMLLEVRQCDDHLNDWLSFGGTTTLHSYGAVLPQEIPREHIDFLEQCRRYYETERHFFVHASYLADVPLADQPDYVLRWDSLRRREPGPHQSGKIAIVGHTAQRNGEILDLGYLKCIDTYCYGGFWLTALEVNTGQVWQVDPEGRLRSADESGHGST
jgi:serine/threonine protein phosphatase 1